MLPITFGVELETFNFRR